jgi:biopolymer transport protein ExbB/TolQ
MQQSKTIGRRELLRGGGVAALAVAGAAVVPFVAKAAQSHAPEDLSLLELWRQRTAAWIVAIAFQDKLDTARRALADRFRHTLDGGAAYKKANRNRTVSALNRENERLHKIPLQLEGQIAGAPFVGALGIVIKMALGFTGESTNPNVDPKTGFICSDHNQLALFAVYRSFAKEAGFDPYVEWCQELWVQGS